MMGSLPAWMGTLPGWITSAGMIGLLGLILKFLPVWRKQGFDEGAALRGELGEELARLRAEVASLKDLDADKGRRLSANEAFCGAIIIRVQQTDFVLDLVLSELEALAPGNTVAKHARHLMAQFLPMHAPSEEIRDQLRTMKQPGGNSR